MPAAPVVELSLSESASVLREKLKDLTDEFTGQDAAEQIPRVAALSLDHPHSIKLIREAKSGDPSMDFVCHEYALGLHASGEARALAFPGVAPDAAFLEWLLAHELLEPVAPPDRAAGDLVVYFSEGKVRHSGLWRHAGVESKWGSCHLWEHSIDEVPSNYGSTARFFKHPGSAAISLFERYVNARCEEMSA